MRRDDFDIPEVFRKAMEEAGWNNGNKDEDKQDKEPPPPRPPQRPFTNPPRPPQRPNRLLWVLGGLFLLFLSLNWIVTTYTEWLWFNEVVYQRVWLTRMGVQVLSFVIAFAIAITLLLGNWHLARRRAMSSTPGFYPQFLQFAGLSWLINGLGAFLAFGYASTAAAQWEQFLLYFNRVPYGVVDPIFAQDISFYFFSLPIYDFLQGWFGSLLFFSLAGVLFLYSINYLPDLQRGRWQSLNIPVMRQHVAIVAASFLAVWAMDSGLEIYHLLYSSRGVVFGASYTDMNASLYGLGTQMVLTLIGALVVAYNAFRMSWRPLLAVGVLWVLTTAILGGIYPAILQRYIVEPNEIARESPYIRYNIDLTRLAFGLDKVETQVFPYGGEITATDLQSHESSLRNVRIWDYRPLQATYEQLQALRPYYHFGEIDIDRYLVNGEIRQVMLAGRELNQNNLPNPTWINQKLEFTHGYGLVMNPVDEVTPDGQPQFYVKDLPPVTTIPLEIARPEIYYGEMTTNPVYVGSEREEFNYPSGNENVYSSYDGLGGVALDSLLRRLAFALRFADMNVLLSDDITNQTRVQFHRTITERVLQITPFLHLDSDPYLVVWNGRLIWILDAYTTSNRFPFATPINDINYIRNAAKITVDAYDGTVTYYLTAPDDPIIQAYAQIFPGLFHPLSEMPEALQAHLRYPEDLFTLQTQQYLTYHMTDVRVFYNREDLRAIPNEILEGQQVVMEPYYVILPLTEDSEPEFLLIQPLTPSSKPNMIAWLTARSDPPFYGQLVEYELPKQELVFGPMQVEGRIDQEPEISQQFSLWDQRGSQVIRGNMIIIPIAGSFLYIEPIYLQSETSALPELKRVIVATNSRIAMRETLEEALLALLGEAPAVEVLEVEPGETAVSPTSIPTPSDATLEAIIQSANDHFNAAEAAQRNGDWNTYGLELDALEQDLQQLLEITTQGE